MIKMMQMHNTNKKLWKKIYERGDKTDIQDRIMELEAERAFFLELHSPVCDHEDCWNSFYECLNENFDIKIGDLLTALYEGEEL
jgi:hypothetical protein